MILSMMVPGIINTVPLYSIMKRINGINTHWAMIFLLACQSLPFSVFLYEGFIRSMSESVEEAAIIDGCSRFGAFWKVTFPLLKPITATVVIMQGVGIIMVNRYSFSRIRIIIRYHWRSRLSSKLMVRIIICWRQEQ